MHIFCIPIDMSLIKLDESCETEKSANIRCKWRNISWEKGKMR